MTAPNSTAANLEATLNDQFRGHDTRNWQEWQAIATSDAQDVPLDATRAWVGRAKASHRGIGERKSLRHLIAGAANQAFLEEICTIDGLERLELEYPVTATSLEPLLSLKNLRHLSIDSPRHIGDFSVLLELPSLKTLLITNAKRMTDIEWLADAHRLEVIGIEGGMWSTIVLPALAPLAGLRGLRAFLATSVRLRDKRLQPLAECPKLKFLGCARFAPREEFERLHALKPDLVCTWFRPEVWQLIGR